MALSKFILVLTLSSFAATTISCEDFLLDVNRVERDFVKYVYLFKEEAANRELTIGDVDLIIKFKKNETPATTKHTRVGIKKIFIDPTHWQDASDTEKEMIIFHELGHALLNRRHLACDNCNCSLMQETAMEPDFFKKHRSLVLDELFSSSKSFCLN